MTAPAIQHPEEGKIFNEAMVAKDREISQAFGLPE